MWVDRSAALICVGTLETERPESRAPTGEKRKNAGKSGRKRMKEESVQQGKAYERVISYIKGEILKGDLEKSCPRNGSWPSSSAWGAIPCGRRCGH